MHRILSQALRFFALLNLAVPTFAQTPAQYLDQVNTIQNDARVKAATAFIDKDRDRILHESFS